jgi:Ras-related protein Rab-1A
MNISSDCDYSFKILLLGDPAVGKTCFLLRFTDETFSETHISTIGILCNNHIGIDYKLKMVNIDEKVVKLQIWDTAGQDRFRAITKNYYKGSHAIFLMYDVTSINSFNSIKGYITQIKENLEDINIMLIGNKIDCDKEDIKVKTSDGKKFATENNISFIETSSKQNINVQETFLEMARKLISKGVGIDKRRVTLYSKAGSEKKKSCCKK